MRAKFPQVVNRAIRMMNPMNILEKPHLSSALCDFDRSDYKEDYRSFFNSNPNRFFLTGIAAAASASTLLMTSNSEEPAKPQSYNRNAYLTNMETLLRTHYPRILDLPEDLLALIISQLDWVQHNTMFTPQASVIYDANDKSVNISNHVNREILRALTRIEMLLLVTQTDLNNSNQILEHYQLFTRDQPATEKLSYNDFLTILHEFQLTANEIDAQIRAVLIGAVTLSPAAKDLVSQSKYAKDCPYDSVQFSGFTISLMPEMYPAFATATPSVQKLIQFGFPNDKQHWRHMFFLENNSAFQDFEKAPHSLESLAFWKRYWLINAFGFNGHLKLDSAVFYDNSVAFRANLLHEAINEHLQNTSVDTAKTYANLFAKHLNIKADEDEALLLTRMMTMINLTSENDAENMLAALEKYPNRDALLQLHKKTFQSDIQVTYLPALLSNVWSYRKNMDDVISIFHWANKIIPSFKNKNPLSFRPMNRDAIERLINANFSDEALVVLTNGEITTQDPPRKIHQFG